MKVYRTQKIKTENIKIGDQIIIKLKGNDIFSATAQKVTEKGILFMFDDCVEELPVNETNTNKGGFEESDLNKRLRDTLLPKFPKKLRKRIVNISIPSYGQIFGHDDWYDDILEPDDDERFPLMMSRKNRIADYDNRAEWYWLRNATKDEYSASRFACVGTGGHSRTSGASTSRGVRPVFLLEYKSKPLVGGAGTKAKGEE